MRLAQSLYCYRKSLSLSLRAAAKEIGVSYSVLDRFERGGEIEAGKWVKIVLWLLEPASQTQLDLIKNPKGHYAKK